VISTANQPPRPLAVCLMALLPSSVATLNTSSRAEQPGRSEDNHRRNAESSRSCLGTPAAIASLALTAMAGCWNPCPPVCSAGSRHPSSLYPPVRFTSEYIDLGTGLPTQGNVHEIARQVIPDARVVYVDNEPHRACARRGLLADSPGTTVITADMREPHAILGNSDLQALIDFCRPVAVLFVAVVHFIRDSEDPAGIVKAFRAVMAPGSYLVLSHLTTDGPPPDAVARTVKVYERATAPIVFRTRRQIAQLFNGFTLQRPGLVRPWQWHPERTDTMHTKWLYAGVGKLT
jgi:hypothetical protein